AGANWRFKDSLGRTAYDHAKTMLESAETDISYKLCLERVKIFRQHCFIYFMHNPWAYLKEILEKWFCGI
ncbi:MAG TPA: hypothetical protein DCG57_11440, partial [Candidatus Riflebacteria bacterium]|nr:hypothetical protein [Candidatus Riflebacteria bacterium]